MNEQHVRMSSGGTLPVFQGRGTGNRGSYDTGRLEARRPRGAFHNKSAQVSRCGGLFWKRNSVRQDRTRIRSLLSEPRGLVPAWSSSPINHPCGHSPQRHRIGPFGFTLVELLVVIAIIGALMSLLLPAVQSAREASRRTVCMNHAYQLSLANLLYADKQSGRLPAMWYSDQAHPWDNFSWRATVLPFIEEQGLHDKLQWDRSPVDPANLPVVGQEIHVFHCPSTPGTPRKVKELSFESQTLTDLRLGAHDYVAVHNVLSSRRNFPYRGAWHGGPDLDLGIAGGGYHRPDVVSAKLRSKPGQLRFVRDGLSKTALLVEQAGKPERLGTDSDVQNHPPYEGAWATCDYGSFYGYGVNRHNFRDPFGFHGGAICVLCDGAVILLPKTIEREIVAALFSRDGSEIVESGDWN